MEADTPPLLGAASQCLEDSGSPPGSSPLWGVSSAHMALAVPAGFPSSSYSPSGSTSPSPFSSSSHPLSLSSSSPTPLSSTSSSALAAPLGSSRHSSSSMTSPSSSLHPLSSSSLSPFSPISPSPFSFFSLPPTAPSLSLSRFPPVSFFRDPLSEFPPSSATLPSFSCSPASAFPVCAAATAEPWTRSGETQEGRGERNRFAAGVLPSGASRRRVREAESSREPSLSTGFMEERNMENLNGEAREEDDPDDASHAGHECPICLEKFECEEMHRPKVLTCGHSMCFSCILQILSNGDSSAITELHQRIVAYSSSSSFAFSALGDHQDEGRGGRQGLTRDEEAYACMRNAAHCSFFQCPLCRRQSRIAADNLALLPSGDEAQHARKSRRDAQDKKKETADSMGSDQASDEAEKSWIARERCRRRAKRPLWEDAQGDNGDLKTSCRRHPSQAIIAYCRPCASLVCALCVAGEDSPHYLHPRTSLGGAATAVAESCQVILAQLEGLADDLRSNAQMRLRAEQMLEDGYRRAFQRGVQRVEELRCHLEIYVTCAASCLADALSEARAQSLEMHRRRGEEEERLLRVASTAAASLKTHVNRLVSASPSSRSSPSSSSSSGVSSVFTGGQETRGDETARLSLDGRSSARAASPLVGRPAKRAHAGSLPAPSSLSSFSSRSGPLSETFAEGRENVSEERLRVFAALLPALRYADATRRFVEQASSEESAREVERAGEIEARCAALLRTRLESLNHVGGGLAVLWKTPRGHAPAQKETEGEGDARERAGARTEPAAGEGRGDENRGSDEEKRRKRERGERREEMDGVDVDGHEPAKSGRRRQRGDREEKETHASMEANMPERDRVQSEDEHETGGKRKSENEKNNFFCRVPYDVCLQGGLTLPLMELVYREYPRCPHAEAVSDRSRVSSVPPPSFVTPHSRASVSTSSASSPLFCSAPAGSSASCPEAGASPSSPAFPPSNGSSRLPSFPSPLPRAPPSSSVPSASSLSSDPSSSFSSLSFPSASSTDASSSSSSGSLSLSSSFSSSLASPSL